MAAKAAPAVPMRGTKISLGFGLVDVPVTLKLLHESQRPVPGKGMCPDHGDTLQSQQVCCAGTGDEHVLASGEKVIGYPHPDNPSKLVVLDPNVVKALEETRSAQASIERVVDASTIDPSYFDKTFLVWPQEGKEEAFDLLSSVLRSQRKAAVVTVVLRKQTQTIVFRWSEGLGVLVGHVIRFETQIRHEEAELVRESAATRKAPPKKALELAKQILAPLEGDFDAGEVQDTLTPLMHDAIRAADDGRVVKIDRPAAPAPVGDLMAALEASVAGVSKPRTARAPKTKKVAA